MFQNHLLQLLCTVAMEPPASFQAEHVRNETAKVMQALRPLALDQIDQTAVRGQYQAGRTQHEDCPAYRVAPDSRTETYAALKVHVDNWRWHGVPFYLQSGKLLKQRRTDIAIRFKHIPHSLFAPLQPGDLTPNTLLLGIHPREAVTLTFETKRPGSKLCMSPAAMDFDYGTTFGMPREAYERLLLDAMSGDQTLFVRTDWISLSWAWLAPVLDHWSAEGEPEPYGAGSWGPTRADSLLTEEGRAWIDS